MDLFNEFINEYGTTIMYGILTALATVLGAWLKKLYTQYVNTETKKKVVEICVGAVEQMYKDLHGEDKYNKVVEATVDMLKEKGITITDLELKMLIESSVSKFNEAFKKEQLTKLRE